MDYIAGAIKQEYVKNNRSYVLVVPGAGASGGIGYEVCIPRRIFGKLEFAQLYIKQTVDQSGNIFRWGFPSIFEKQLFEILLDVPGIAGTSAMAIFSALQPNEIVGAIIRRDEAALSPKGAGIGAKKAQAIISQVRDKIMRWDAISSSPEFAAATDKAATSLIPSDAKEEVIAAASALGFSKKEIMEALEQLNPESDSELEPNYLISKTISILCGAEDGI